MMKQLFLFSIFALTTFLVASQKLKIINLEGAQVEVTILSDSLRQKHLQDFIGILDNQIRKKWTARSFRLSDGRILVEFYDKQAALINSFADFERLNGIRFIKTYIGFLKRNISYKIETTLEKGIAISKGARQISSLKSESPEYRYFEVYELATGQILFISKGSDFKSATVYENMKALCSENSEVLHQYYQGMEQWTEKLIKGDPLLDYEPNQHLVYPNDILNLINNHKLSKIESKVYVEEFYGNLYRSENNYYVLIDEVDQKNGAGNKMLILTVRVYEHLQKLRDAQANYEQKKGREVRSEHFYQKISDRYGNNFPSVTKQLIGELPSTLNFDKEQLTFDSVGMAIVDEAIFWNHSNHKLFNKWFPGVLAYYGHCYMADKNDGKWVIRKEDEDNVLTPHLVLSNNEDAFDVYDFYKDLYEWPIPIKEAGDWEGVWRKMRKSR